MEMNLDGDLLVCAGSYSADFPTTDGAYDRSFNGDIDGAIFRMNGALNELEVSTFLGGINWDSCASLDLDVEGDVFVSGRTWGTTTTFPTTDGAYDRTPNGSYDFFISRFDQELTTLEASTLFGGHLYEAYNSQILAVNDGVYLAGNTASSDFPTTPGAYDETFNYDGSVWHDMFISNFDRDLTTLNRSTFLGGTKDDLCGGIILDQDGTIVIVGSARSSDFPTTPGVYDREWSGQADFAICRMSAQLDELIASTFVGGEETDNCYAAALDEAGYIVAVGRTDSESIPITPGVYGSVNFEKKDCYIVRLDRDFERLTAAMILGGETDVGFDTSEACFDVDFIEGDKIIVCGETHTYSFPTTSGAYAESSAGSHDGFISIFDELLTLHAGKVIVGPGPSHKNSPLVRVYPAAQDAPYGFEFSAYGAPHYGVNVCCGNLDQDPADEIITGAGPGEIYGPHVRGFEIDGAPLPGLSFIAYGTLRFGVNVAAGDIDGDGYEEIITGAGPGEVFGPHVRAFDYDGTPGVSPVPGVSYLAYGTPKWGVNVAAGDIDGDGFEEIVSGPGPGAVYGPHVRGWNVDGGGAAAIPQVSFLAYGTNKYGVNVSCGDLDGDGIDEIVTGAGPGAVFGAHVRCWDYDGTSIVSLPGSSFFAWPPDGVRYGVNVSSGTDMDGDGRDELLAGSGPDPGADATVKVFTYDDSTMSLSFSLTAFSNLGHGVNVTAGRF